MTLALIPALKPPATLPSLVGELARHGMRIVVIDDGSEAGSQPIFDAIRTDAVVLRHDVNRGKGAALRTGMAWVAANCAPDTIVVTVDADGQHLPDDVVRVADAATGLERGIVLGSRQDDETTPLRSRAGHTVTRLLSRLAIGQRLTDTQTGLRAFPATLIPWLLDIPGDRYDYEMNMLIIAGRDKVALREVPIQTVYLGKNGTSHYRAFVDSFRIAKGMFAFAGSSFISFCIDYLLYAGLVTVGSALGVPYVVTGSNVLARIGSATVNYNLNKRYVFQDERPAKHSAAQYALLAAGILIGNTAVLTWLTDIGVNAYFAKIVVETVFSLVSYTLQRAVVFNHGGAAHD
ncbi:MAG: bifunctional glycosyltransferase family 2/GtrA family protein [Propionibacteriaceae bacterium]|jgi:glycosyltransferase involved in cell wall biosynthesis|nr:bifunctional glycosyltransferase family 2/GtrA family protein [Propionibacteriaceae bacterium]